MYCGTPYLCLSVKDLDTSRQFYEALGMAVTEEVPGKRVILREGHFSLTLMPFLTENLLNFRGADVFAVHDFLQREGFELDGSPERYTKEQYDADADGESWATCDPDGNQILFDTNEHERSDEFRRQRLAELLESTARELVTIGAGPDVLAAFRTHVLEPFGPPPNAAEGDPTR